MSYGLMVFRADLNALRRLYGSHDPDWSIYDPYEEEDLPPEGEMSAEHALDEIVRGKLSAGNLDTDAAQYGYALKLWCEACGTALDNDKVMPWNGFMSLPDDSVLLPVRDLAWSGPPLALPDPPDFPMVGHLDAAHVDTALAAFGQLDLSGYDPMTREILEQYCSWLREAKTHGRD